MFKNWKASAKLVAAATASVLAIGLSGCGGSSSGSGGGSTFTILQFEAKGAAEYQAWQDAVTIFKQRHPKVQVKISTTSFDSIRRNAKLLLNGSNVPDVVEVNKGNADGGQLAAQGLLTDLTPQVKKHGWDTVVTGATQNLARYDSNGNAGSGNWYGIPNSGQYYLMYYNKDLFDQAGIPLPTAASQLGSTFDAFMAKGQVPISSNAGEFGLAQLWWQFVSSAANRQQIDDYMFLKGKTDFTSGPFAAASQQLQQWIDKGYLGSKLGALTQEQMETAFLSGHYPLMGDGSWVFTNVKAAAKFNWGTLLIPSDSGLNEGLTGQLWSVPAKAKDKDLAYDWIDVTLSKPVQDKIGKLGGLPLRSDTSVIPDPQVKAFTEQYNTLVQGDKLTYFPDYPVPGLLDFMESEMQGMANHSKTPAQFDADLQKFYDHGRATLKNG